MSTAPRILAFAGSAREDSYNKKLIRLAARFAREAGAEVTLVDLRELPLPLFDQDEEAAHGLPENAKRLKELMKQHQGLLISSPEYNSSISPLLKNAIDWASREEPGEGPLAAYRGKVAGLLAASPGALGGLRGLVHVRAILGNIGVLVLPEQVAVMRAHEAFDESGALKDPHTLAAVERVAVRLVDVVRRLAD